ncbi:pyridoxal phosphate-dependent aminotransferase [Photobacterium profundum]|uniref:cysteine-S-conjugate beta-lyase n=1 Tax=Photobacterium profundum 3TCK TaxID=314280 RepID=Q1Z8H0_9GAMM|nr:MalY/PatB family protein [Photobacterium profundum]EAS45138.1 putative PLP-dependent enzyme with beta-cystathionase and maltose regulon repressor activities [Photobacterium profundum 3TCK]PSV60533.1 pyridoxal phosphate-dependent aminotransferase [Photobacterium profundum]
MTTHFDQVNDRHNSGSLKWDFMEQKLGLQENGLLPMWVSDYDFKAPPAVLEALNTRIEHGIFGYAERNSEYYQAIINWYKARHNVTLPQSCITTVHGVLPGLSIVIQMLTNTGDGVVMQTPGYGSFRKITELNDRHIIENPLTEKNGYYTMDLDHLESCFSAGAKVMILCNPHNPVGRAWSESEMITVAELCKKYNVWLLSDEIWGDLTMPNHCYFSALSLPNELQQQLVVATAASKTFGLSSMRISNFMIPNETLRRQFTRRLDSHGMDVYNSMAMCAATTAYQTSAQWLDELKNYLQSNIEYLDTFIGTQLPMLKFQQPEAGYLAWVDCRQLGLDDKQLEKQMVSAGIVPSMGIAFGEDGKGFIRLNLGCPRTTLIEACQRIKQALNK